VLAGATVVLAVISAIGAWQSRRAADAASEAAEAAGLQAIETRRAADATVTAAQAAIDDARASAESVAVAREALVRSQRPVLTSMQSAEPGEGITVLPGTSTTSCAIRLRNVGTGTAIIELGHQSTAIQVRPSPTWFPCEVATLVLPVGESVVLSGKATLIPTDDTGGQAATIYVRITYSDLAGNSFTTYLCLMRDEEVESWQHADIWSLHGVALDDGTAMLMSGEGWTGLVK